jgi:Holliday junction resolvasome RuvABC ATP-dependent DNA helicase subunit
MTKWSNVTDWDTLIDVEQMTGPVHFLGGMDVKAQLSPFLHAESFPHTLITGEPGLGKTHLARWIAAERKAFFTELYAPVRENQLPIVGIVLIDEVHLQRRAEWLFPLMENRTGPVFIGVTKSPEKLDDAFRRRFSLRLKLFRYPLEEMKEVIDWYASQDLDDETLTLFAQASAGNPDQAVRIISTAETLGSYDPETVLRAVRINADGLTDDHMEYLKLLSQIGRPVGVGYIATRLYTNEDSIKRLESLLNDMQLIELTPKGRDLTRKGRAYTQKLVSDGLV